MAISSLPNHSHSSYVRDVQRWEQVGAGALSQGAQLRRFCTYQSSSLQVAIACISQLCDTKQIQFCCTQHKLWCHILSLSIVTCLPLIVPSLFVE